MTTGDGFKVIESYMAAIAGLAVQDGIYRGHADDRWLLTPAAFRGPIDNGIRNSAHLERWKLAASRFADRRTTDLEWLVFAQHYGVATPLLDWTTNPLVALYFCCLESINKAIGSPTDGVIHMLPREALPKAPTNRNWDPFGGYDGPPLIIDTLGMNPRTLAQDSVMTIHQEATCHPQNNLKTIIFSVSKNQKRDTLSSLKKLGVSSDRIFVDIGVIAREFTEELTREAAIQAIRPPQRPIAAD